MSEDHSQAMDISEPTPTPAPAAKKAKATAKTAAAASASAAPAAKKKKKQQQPDVANKEKRGKKDNGETHMDVVPPGAPEEGTAAAAVNNAKDERKAPKKKKEMKGGKEAVTAAATRPKPTATAADEAKQKKPIAPGTAPVGVQAGKVEKPVRRARGPLQGTKHSRSMVRKMQTPEEHIFNRNFMERQIKAYVARYAGRDAKGKIRFTEGAKSFVKRIAAAYLTRVVNTADRFRRLEGVSTLKGDHVLLGAEFDVARFF